jgi:hypothetical protein
MCRKALLVSAIGASLTFCFAASSANAYIIDFEGLTAPQGGAYDYPGPLTISTPIGNVVFSGGEILGNEFSLPADQSNVYYSSFFAGGTTNPITITFPQNINDFFLNLYNGETYSDPFTVSDNVGNTNTQTLVSNGAGGNAFIAFAASGDVVQISTTDPAFDFSIDSIGFDQGLTLTPTPLPSSLPLIASAFGVLGLIGWYSRRNGSAIAA